MGKPRHSASHRDEETVEIGNQPDQPYYDAKLVEVNDEALIFTRQHHACPDGVDEHEQDRKDPGQPVDAEGLGVCHLEHDAGSGGIADQPQPEKRQVPALQAACQALTPHAD